MKKADRTKMIITILIVIALALFTGGFFTHSKFVADKLIRKEAGRIKTEYEKKLSEKDVLIKEKEESLRISEAKYSKLKAKIKEKVNEAQQPQTPEELRKRFTNLGYPSK